MSTRTCYRSTATTAWSWNNAIRGVFNGISFSPIVVGPLFAIRTLIDGYKEHALKINNGPEGWMFVYHTTSVPSDNPEAQAFSPDVPFQHFVTRNNVWTGHRYVIEGMVTPSGPVDFDWDNLTTDSLDGTPRFVKWLDVKYASLAELKASNTIEQHGFDVTPQYENGAGGDFTPVAGSGLLDVGLAIPGINDRSTVGSGPDLGAFERGGVGPGNDAGLPEAAAGSGGSGGGTGTGGTGGSGGAGGSGGGGLLPDGGTAGKDAGGDGAPPATSGGEAASDSSCGCATPGSSRSIPEAWLLLAAAAVMTIKRRRRPS